MEIYNPPLMIPVSIPTGIPITGGGANRILFENAAQLLATDADFIYDPVLNRAAIGGPILGAALTLYTSVDIMYWINGAKACLMSENGFSPSNLGTNFHVNSSGTTDGFAVQEDPSGTRTALHSFYVVGSVPNRTVPQCYIEAGPTPAAGGDILTFFLTGGAVKLAKFARNGVISCTPSAATAEAFGNGAISNNSFTTALGDTASATGAFSSAFGSNSNSSGLASFACGPFAAATNASAMGLGVGAAASADSSIAVGRNSVSAFANAIVFGQGATAGEVNSALFGSSAQPITELFLGNGYQNAAPADVTVHGVGALSNDSVGGLLRLGGGRSTGNAVGAGIAFLTSDAGVSSGAPRALTEKARFDGLGNLCLGVTTGGATAARNLVLSNSATEPTTSVDRAQLYAKDLSADNATLGLFVETAVAADVGLASTNSLTVFINGAKYKIPLVLVP